MEPEDEVIENYNQNRRELEAAEDEINRVKIAGDQLIDETVARLRNELQFTDDDGEIYSYVSSKARQLHDDFMQKIAIEQSDIRRREESNEMNYRLKISQFK